MKKVLLILFLLNSSLIFGQGNFSLDESNPELDRVIKDELLIEIGAFYPSDEGLYRPELFVFDAPRNKFFIYDYGIKNLVSVEFSGKDELGLVEIKEIGNGIGSGPGEFRNPTDICLSGEEDNSKLVLIDPDLARVSIWSTTDERFLNSFRPKKFVPFRLSCNNDKIILFNSGFHPNGSLVVYNYEGDLISYLKEPGRSKDNISNMESGYLGMNASDIFYAGTDSEVIKKFSHKENIYRGKSYFVAAAKDETKIEVSKNENEITYKKGESFLYRSRGIGVLNDLLFVFYSGRKDAYGNTIDFYSIEDLSYKFSTHVEGLANEMIVNREYILFKMYDFDRKENHIKIYKMNDQGLED